jgi:hypothetical protein
MSRFSSSGSTLVLATPDAYWITRECVYERMGAIYAVRIVALDASDVALGREVFQAIRDFGPCDPDKIEALLDQFERDYPDTDKWLDRYDSVAVGYVPKRDAQNLEMRAAPAGTEKPQKSFLAASSSDAEIGSHIRSVLKKVRPQSRPISDKRPAAARVKRKS